MLRIRNLRKEFFSIRRRVVALDDVSLEVDAGAFYVLLGPSGCGKTTLLNIVAGIEGPTSGEIWIKDALVVSPDGRINLPPRSRNVAMVFQSYALYPHMTVYQNIAFPLSIAKKSRSEIDAAVERIARTLEISTLLRARPAELSGGQRQRVAIGRALVRSPSVLLLDEPLSNLDAQLRVTMRRELKELQRRMSVTTLYVTHDQVEAMTLGDEIALMRKGVIEQVGSPDDIYNRPESLFAAQFVGTPPMNLIDAALFERMGRPLRIPGSAEADDIVAGVRPESIVVGAAGDSGTAGGTGAESAAAPLRGAVSLVGSLGIEKLLYIKIDDHEILAKCPASGAFSEGEAVALRFDEEDVVLFSRRTGRRVKTARVNPA